ncbi:amidohydrolase [Wilcoxina mikolae CBS 423.85]|nr:amidohydrolase [Wilcoxina mikolae CBS 423.85]
MAYEPDNAQTASTFQTGYAEDDIFSARRTIENSIGRHKAWIADEINKKIWKNPELAWKEHQAHDTICNFFDSLGDDYKVTRSAYDIDTCMTVEAGTGSGRLVVFNAEYDALPRMGLNGLPAHACGHNLIASASVAAFIAASEALKDSNGTGRLRLLGTPAEESGGGKVRLIGRGAYDDVDACIMVHPGPKFVENPELAAVSVTSTLASQRVSVSFHGKSSHAGFAPWEGKNALDALVISYVNISALRQQLKPTTRVCGIITEGGKAPNIIPDHTSAEFSIRAIRRDELRELCNKMKRCFEAGAAAADCQTESKPHGPYLDTRANQTLCARFTEHMNEFGSLVINELPGFSDNPGASTDQGNVSYVCPSIEPTFAIDAKDGVVNHNPGFTETAGTEDAFERAMACGKGMAAVAYEVLTDDSVAEKVRKEFETIGWETVKDLVRKLGHEPTDNPVTELAKVSGSMSELEGLSPLAAVKILGKRAALDIPLYS